MFRLGEYMRSDAESWQAAKERAAQANSWFTPEFIDLAANHIAENWLDEKQLSEWIARYPQSAAVKELGLVMAGNIPLVGFHDFLCGFLSGHRMALKLSSKDSVLIRHLAAKLEEWDPAVAERIAIREMLQGCDAYIATGSNNSARYFEQYFAKYPHIIRKNRTSAAVLTGKESPEDLQELAKDVFLYFGLGCRNVTQLCVPEGYDFTKLLDAFGIYADMIQHHRYKNNYDYHLAIFLLNKVPYLTNESVILVENELPFSAPAVVHYRYYKEREAMIKELEANDEIQCIVAEGKTGFGKAQWPGLGDFADGVDTMAFLAGLK